jgi:hypothetical protein
MRKLPLEHLLERPSPKEVFPGLPAPEFLWSVDRLRVELTVFHETSEVCLAFESGRGLEYSALTGN